MPDRLGLQSMQAETAKDALELLADTVDVLFTDIELPGGINGTELARRHTSYTRSSKCCSLDIILDPLSSPNPTRPCCAWSGQ